MVEIIQNVNGILESLCLALFSMTISNPSTKSDAMKVAPDFKEDVPGDNFPYAVMIFRRG